MVHKLPLVRILVAALGMLATLGFAQDASSRIIWRDWSYSAFDEAARDRKFVLLQIGDSWCHWCLVMERSVFHEDGVQRLLKEKYITIRADRSARPDLANRYRAYAAPLTVIFNEEGGEILRLQGFRSPVQMAAILREVIEDPSPGPSVTEESTPHVPESPQLPAALQEKLRQAFPLSYEQADGGLDFGLIYLDADSIEYVSELTNVGDTSLLKYGQKSTRLARSLIDSVSGGIQQSLVVASNVGQPGLSARYLRVQIGGGIDTSGFAGNEPYSEMPLWVQAQALLLFARSHVAWQRPEDFATALRIHDFVSRTLAGPDGTFFVGQEESPVEGRLRVSQRVYARENGWMVQALCAFYSAGGGQAALDQAQRAAQWIVSNLVTPDGGFAHEKSAAGGMYLGDTLAMGRAFVALYQATGDHDWLHRAEAAARFIVKTFGSEADAGYVTALPTDRAYRPKSERKENADLVRFFSLVARLTGERSYGEMAARAMRYLAAPEIATDGLPAAILLAQLEFSRWTSLH